MIWKNIILIGFYPLLLLSFSFLLSHYKIWGCNLVFFQIPSESIISQSILHTSHLSIWQWQEKRERERSLCTMKHEVNKKIDTYKYLFVSMAFEYLNVYEFFNILAVSMYFQICNFRSVAHIHYDLNSSSSVFSILTFHSTFD